MKKIRTAVIGAGKMGDIHAKVYSQAGRSAAGGGGRHGPAAGQNLAEQYGCQAIVRPETNSSAKSMR